MLCIACSSIWRHARTNISRSCIGRAAHRTLVRAPYYTLAALRLYRADSPSPTCSDEPLAGTVVAAVAVPFTMCVCVTAPPEKKGPVSTSYIAFAAKKVTTVTFPGRARLTVLALTPMYVSTVALSLNARGSDTVLLLPAYRP